MKLLLLLSTVVVATIMGADGFVASSRYAITIKDFHDESLKTKPTSFQLGKRDVKNVFLKAVAVAGQYESDDSADDSSSSTTRTTVGGTASMSSLTFNLVKSIVGAGVLSLPAGISAFGNAPSAMIPATALIAIIGALSGYGFSLIGRVCSYTGSTTYREAWEKSINKETSMIAAASCTLKTIGATLAYSMILADTFNAIFSSVGFNFTRTNTLLGVTSIVLLPLCLLKNLSSLAPFSLLGVFGMAYTAFAMAFRFLTRSYAPPAGRFLADIPTNLQPSFGTTGATGVFNPKSFILIGMLSTAYMAHFNAPKFYSELENNTIKRYNKLVSTSFAISIALFASMAACGFLTFGAASSGLILNNYSNTDFLMGISRLAVAVSIVFSYPLAFAGCRDGLLDVAKVPLHKRSNSLLNKVTIGALSVITTLALVLNDVSFVLSFAGATLGNALIYIYPAIMFRGAVKKMGEEATPGLKREVQFALANGCLGIGMGVIGAGMAVKSLAR